MALDLTGPDPEHVFKETFGEEDGSGQWRLSYTVGVTARGMIALRTLTIKPVGPRITDAMPDETFMAAMNEGVRRVLRRQVPGAGITARLLRSIHLEPARKQIEAELLSQPKRPSILPGRRPRARTRRTPGRPPVLTPTFYRGVARRWFALLRERDPHPLQTLADEYGRGYPNMAAVIRRCRAMKLIPTARVPAHKR